MITLFYILIGLYTVACAAIVGPNKLDIKDWLRGVLFWPIIWWFIALPQNKKEEIIKELLTKLKEEDE